MFDGLRFEIILDKGDGKPDNASIKFIEAGVAHPYRQESPWIPLRHVFDLSYIISMSLRIRKNMLEKEEEKYGKPT